MTATKPEVTIEGIAALCRRYADRKRLLHERTERILEARRRAASPYMRGLGSAVAELSAAEDELRAAIEAGAHLFERPRTRALEGVKVGFRKMPGTLAVADEAATLARIRRQVPHLEPTLVVTREGLNKAALRKLDAGTLAAIGASIVEVDDEVVIRTPKSAIEALVDALLAEFEEDGEDRRAA